MSITPKAIQDLLDELEASRQARRRAWDVLQDLRAVLTKLGNVTIETPSLKAFEIEGAILKQALSNCLRDQRTALAQCRSYPCRILDKTKCNRRRAQEQVGATYGCVGSRMTISVRGLPLRTALRVSPLRYRAGANNHRIGFPDTVEPRRHLSE
jgi:hypothetical protein